MSNFVEVTETGGSVVEVVEGGASAVEVIESSTLVEVLTPPAPPVVEVLAPESGTVIDVLPAPGYVVEVLDDGGGEVIEVFGPGEGSVLVDFDAVIEDRTASGHLSGHRVVVVSGGTVSYADPTNAAHATRPMRLTLQAIMSGEQGEVLVLGETTEPSWNWTGGAPLYVGAGGVLTETPPTDVEWTRIIAYALSPTNIYFDPQPPIHLV